MENRWSERKWLELGVEVFKAGDKLLDCVSRDIGLGGTYLTFDDGSVPAEALSKDYSGLKNGAIIDTDTDVEIVFHANDGASATKYYLHAKVIRVTESGLGLKFHDFDTSVFRSLQELLNYKYKQQSAVN
ncbi:MAG: hypothetical protein ACC707_15705 [Thiohalomonadales bacterium]